MEQSMSFLHQQGFNRDILSPFQRPALPDTPVLPQKLGSSRFSHRVIIALTPLFVIGNQQYSTSSVVFADRIGDINKSFYVKTNLTLTGNRSAKVFT